jgi:diaminopropionate ammonia-lyase
MPAPPRWHARPAARDWTCLAAPRDVLAFHHGLPGYTETPLTELPALAAQLGVGRLFVKDESTRLGLSAFKVLGASWAVAQVIAARACLTGPAGPLTFAAVRAAAGRLPLTLVTATDGNHGRAVARMAALLGLRAQIFVPQVISPRAAAAIAAEGADVTTVAGSYDEAVEAAAASVAGRSDRELIQDTAWPGYEQVPGWIVDGYATLLREVDDQLRQAGAGGPGVVAVPVGVGSLVQAVVIHYRSGAATSPAAVLSAEPDTAACVLASLTAGELRSVATAATIMAGLNCGTPSSLCWPYLRKGLDAAIAVGDDDAARAVTDLAALGVSSGPSGAAALAGARAALTGPGSEVRRAELGAGRDSIVVVLSTEGAPKD